MAREKKVKRDPKTGLMPKWYTDLYNQPRPGDKDYPKPGGSTETEVGGGVGENGVEEEVIEDKRTEVVPPERSGKVAKPEALTLEQMNSAQFSSAQDVGIRLGNRSIQEHFGDLNMKKGGDETAFAIKQEHVNRYTKFAFGGLPGDGSVGEDMDGGGVTPPANRSALDVTNEVLAEYQDKGKDAFLNTRVNTGLDLEASGYNVDDRSKPQGFGNWTSILTMARKELRVDGTISRPTVFDDFSKETLDKMGERFADDEGNPGIITLGQIEKLDLQPRQGDGTTITDEYNEQGDMISKHAPRGFNSMKIPNLGMIRAAQQDKNDILTHVFGGVKLRTHDDNTPRKGYSNTTIAWGGNVLPDKEHTQNTYNTAVEGMGHSEKTKYGADLINLFVEGFAYQGKLSKKQVANIARQITGIPKNTNDRTPLTDYYWRQFGNKKKVKKDDQADNGGTGENGIVDGGVEAESK